MSPRRRWRGRPSDFVRVRRRAAGLSGLIAALALLTLFHPLPVAGAELEEEAATEYSGAATGEGVGEKGPSLLPFLITFGVHGGYDSNPRTESDPVGSWFTQQELTLSYERLRESTTLAILARGGAVERFNANLHLLFFTPWHVEALAQPDV